MQVKSIAEWKEHSEILLTFIRLPFDIKIFVLSILSGRFTQVWLYTSTCFLTLKLLHKWQAKKMTLSVKTDNEGFRIYVYDIQENIHSDKEIIFMSKRSAQIFLRLIQYWYSSYPRIEGALNPYKHSVILMGHRQQCRPGGFTVRIHNYLLHSACADPEKKFCFLMLCLFVVVVVFCCFCFCFFD